MIMLAEIFKDGKWHKVGKEFISWWQELSNQLTDRVCDEPNNFFLLSALGKNIGFIRGYNIPLIKYNSGWPDDISKDVANILQGKRTFYIDLTDLLNYPLDKSLYLEGYITEWQYRRLKDKGIKPVHILKPSSMSNYDDDRHEFITPYQMDLIIGNPSLRQNVQYYVLYEYAHTTLRDECEFFYTKSIPKLIELSNGGKNKIRILYSFGR